MPPPDPHPPTDQSDVSLASQEIFLSTRLSGPEKRERFDFSEILSPEELDIIAHPERWRWISSLTEPDVKPIHHPKYFEFTKKTGHRPSHRELFLSLSGQLHFVLNDKVYLIEPGTIIMFNSHELHNLKLSNMERAFRNLWLHISNHHAISSNLNCVDENGDWLDYKLKLISGHNPELMSELWRRCSDPEHFTPVLWAFLKSVITTCLYESIGDWQNQYSTHPHEVIVRSVQEYIQANLDQELTLQTLAKHAGYSPYFFHRIFLKYSNMPLHRYIIEARLDRAKALLESGQTVTSVSEQIGMVSPSYFSRFFKKHTRLNPTSWREYHQVQKQAGGGAAPR